MRPEHHFNICGNTNRVHPELRCELNIEHNRVVLAKDVMHRSGDVIWDSSGGHRHLGKFELAVHKASEQVGFQSAFGQPSFNVAYSQFLPRGQVFLLNTESLFKDDPMRGHLFTNKTYEKAAAMFGTDRTSETLDELYRPKRDPETFTPEETLAAWWRQAAESEIDQTVAKAVEYGSTDLIDIGRDLARVADRDLDDEEAAEWGIYFYLLGKMSRWRSAMERGDRVSDDTLLDIGVYARMAQRVRIAGSWPGVEEDDE